MIEPVAGSKDAVSFGPFSLDPSRRLLLKDGAPIVLGARTLDTLIALVARPNQAISKRELMAGVWPDVTVEEGSLRVQIAALRKALGDGKGGARYITTLAGRGYCFVAPISRVRDRGGEHAAATKPALALPDKPSIAVLPFQNMSGDPEQEYFADGIVEEIITALSRVKWFFVIARNSSFTYKGRAVDVKQVGRELGVRYVLEGSVRKEGRRLRITGQLIQGETAQHIWADRFDGEVADVFDLQDQITTNVVAAIEPSLRQAEIDRARRKPTERLDAYDCYLRALPHFYVLTREGVDAAIALLNRAIAIDPHFALAKALAARCYAWRNPQGWAAAPQEEKAIAVRLGGEALGDGPDDPTVLWMVGFALWQLRVDPERALELYDKSLALNANCAQALALRGWALATAGRPDEAAPPLLQAIRLSPYDPEAFFTMSAIGCAYLMAGRFDEAIKWTSRALRERPSFAPALRFHAACLVELSRVDEARDTVAHLLLLEPELTISVLRQRAPIFDPKLMNAYLDRLRKAGLPD